MRKASPQVQTRRREGNDKDTRTPIVYTRHIISDWHCIDQVESTGINSISTRRFFQSALKRRRDAGAIRAYDWSAGVESVLSGPALVQDGRGLVGNSSKPWDRRQEGMGVKANKRRQLWQWRRSGRIKGQDAAATREEAAEKEDEQEPPKSR